MVSLPERGISLSRLLKKRPLSRGQRDGVDFFEPIGRRKEKESFAFGFFRMILCHSVPLCELSGGLQPGQAQ
jgi:hypothetical protein